MYLYKAACPDIPNPKQKGSRGQGGNQVQGSGHVRLVGQNSMALVSRVAAPIMLWTTSRNSVGGATKMKHLEDFLNFHGLLMQDTEKNRTGMLYR